MIKKTNLAFIVGRISFFMLNFSMVFRLLIFFVWASSVDAADKYLVTAAKIYTPEDQALSSTKIFTEEDIEKYGSIAVPEFLQAQAGLYFNSQGAYGGTQILKHRGLTGFTKIIIDDVELEDPSTIGGSFQLQMLSLDQVESIEVINGAHSVLYGTDSVSGVIKINTKKGKRGSIIFGGGSHETGFASAYFSQKFKKLTYRFSGSLRSSQGISSFNKNRTANAERDSFDSVQLTPSLDYKINNKSKLYFSLHALTTNSEIDPFGSDQSENDRSDFDNGRFTLKYQNRVFDDRWEYKVTYSQSDVKRVIEIPSTSEYRGKSKKADFYNNIYWNKTINSLFGFDYERREATAISPFDNFNDISTESSSFYTTHIFNHKKLTSESSYRFQVHSDFGNVNAYKQAFLFSLPFYSQLKTSYGHSFRSPTLYELRSTNFGNPDLNPTHVHTTDLGIETQYKDFKNSITYFHNSLKDAVGFSSSQYFNINKLQTQGIEFAQDYQFENSNLKVIYTYTDVKNETTNQRASKIPKEKYSILYTKNFSKKFQILTSLNHIGNRYSSIASLEMASYTLLDLSFKYTRDKRDYSIYIHNLFNKDYEDSFNYGTRGFSVYAWVKTFF